MGAAERWVKPLALAIVVFLAMMETTSSRKIQTCLHNICADCIQEPTCMWCDNMETPNITRCKSANDEQASVWRKECGISNVNEPENYFEIVKDEDFSEGDGSSGQYTQMKPQQVKMELRVQEPYNMTLKYRHASNYPVDLYYLMDGSKSMQDDKEVISGLGVLLAENITKITSNFRLGFGIFVDKPLLPYISTVPWDEQTPCENCSRPYAFKNALSLTQDASAFEKIVKESKTATNTDFPEGGLDALMQATVCEEEIDWRKESLRLIVLSTDAGFHYAGDGKLGGVVAPNDMLCHLDSTGSYTNYANSDYPSVSQIKDITKKNRINLVFAITKSQEPLYNRLSQEIGASSGILAKDSSNIVALLTNIVRDIIGTVELQSTASGPVKIRYFSTCKDNVMKERSKCEKLEPGDEVEFKVEVTVDKCPQEEDQPHQFISIYSNGRKETVGINVTMMCHCSCEKPGDKGYIEDADQCNNHGDYECGVCRCHPEYIGRHCECKASSAGATNVTSDLSCMMPNTTVICSGVGTCVCGECQCNKRQPPEVISGKFCQCTNYMNCHGPAGLCSGNGECECSKCKCNEGWKGKYCDCQDSEDNCRKPGMTGICSDNGVCECNQCKCKQTYFGKYCEDCSNCTGKCDAYKSCVQCQSYQTGEFPPEVCRSNCTLFNATKVPEVAVEKDGERLCRVRDDNGCYFAFVYGQDNNGTVIVRVQKDVECPVPLNIWGFIFGILGVVVLIGIATLIAWRVIVTIHDRREYQQFVLNQKDAQWIQNENPLYKQATTTVMNPMFDTNG